ncbi:MAG: hypothetical protein FWH36_03950 [Lentimicrobiaceae bacterium]|nr:hypothetical protein [Lentimicrobiaceae bacterium]
MFGNRRMICYLIGLCLICFSCEGQSVQEFKKKYDWGESVATYIDTKYVNVKSHIFQYEYNGTFYKEQANTVFVYIGSLLPGYKYPILVDKNNPSKNFIILYDQPILQDSTVIYQTVGKIRMVYKNAGMVQIQYKSQITSASGDIEYYKRDEFLPIEYLEICKKMKKEKKTIRINIYPFNYQGFRNNETVYISFIDRTSLGM